MSLLFYTLYFIYTFTDEHLKRCCQSSKYILFFFKCLLLKALHVLFLPRWPILAHPPPQAFTIQILLKGTKLIIVFIILHCVAQQILKLPLPSGIFEIFCSGKEAFLFARWKPCALSQWRNGVPEVKWHLQGHTAGLVAGSEPSASVLGVPSCHAASSWPRSRPGHPAHNHCLSDRRPKAAFESWPVATAAALLILTV